MLREIEYLSVYYDIVVIGHGKPDPNWQNVTWYPIDRRTQWLDEFAIRFFLLVGKLWNPLYETGYWLRPLHKKALHCAIACQADAFYANDWQAIPIAVEASRHDQIPILFDAHEYAPLQREDHLLWKLFYSPLISHMIFRYAPRISATITVAIPIAKRYEQEYSLGKPIVVYNAPKQRIDHPKQIDHNHIQLIHHGGAHKKRQLELMIRAIALTDPRFSLHFMLVGSDTYINKLRRLANQIAPDRVFFHQPVAPSQIVEQIHQYDMGFYLLKPSNYNQAMGTPNKFFDFLAAGLAVCIGPSPAMAELVHQYRVGIVASSFNPIDVANTLNKITVEQIVMMQHAACKASLLFNAETEMVKVVNLCKHLLSESAPKHE